LWCFAEGFGENEGEQRGVGWSIATASDGREDVERTDSLVATLQWRDPGLLDRGFGGAAVIGHWRAHRTRLRSHPGAVRGPSGDCWKKLSPLPHPVLLPSASGPLQFPGERGTISTSPDKSMTDAIAYLIAHRKSRQDRLPIRAGEEAALSLDLSFVGEPWWPLVVPDTKPKGEPTHTISALQQIPASNADGFLTHPRT
jgi:hypothetical protein